MAAARNASRCAAARRGGPPRRRRRPARRRPARRPRRRRPACRCCAAWRRPIGRSQRQSGRWSRLWRTSCPGRMTACAPAAAAASAPARVGRGRGSSWRARGEVAARSWRCACCWARMDLKCSNHSFGLPTDFSKRSASLRMVITSFCSRRSAASSPVMRSAMPSTQPSATLSPWPSVCVRTCSVCISICRLIEFSSHRSVTSLSALPSSARTSASYRSALSTLWLSSSARSSSLSCRRRWRWRRREGRRGRQGGEGGEERSRRVVDAFLE